jgi:MbtH protein
MTEAQVEMDEVYVVVMNSELQYSIWWNGRALPGGWEAVGVMGSKKECLAYIADVWKDMRPRGIREASVG